MEWLILINWAFNANYLKPTWKREGVFTALVLQGLMLLSVWNNKDTSRAYEAY